MEQASPSSSPNLAKIFIRFALSVVGLLILRGVIGSLPMLKGSPAFGDSLINMLLLCYLVIDTLIILVILSFGLTLAREVRAKLPKFVDVGTIIARATIVVVLIIAYRAYETPVACLYVDQTDLLNLGKTSNPTPGAYADFMRLFNQMAGQVTAAAMQNASGDALAQYQKLAVALFRQPPNIYAWVFLILIGIPVVSLVPLVARNLDNFTELVSQVPTTLDASARAQPSGTLPVAAALSSPVDITEKLLKLKSLLDAGAISTEDFRLQKSKILSRPISTPNSAVEAEDLRKLKSLLDDGTLTQEEFETCKIRFLEQI